MSKQVAIKINNKQELVLFRTKIKHLGQDRLWFMPLHANLCDLSFVSLPCYFIVNTSNGKITGWLRGDMEGEKYAEEEGFHISDLRCFLCDIFPNFEVEGYPSSNLNLKGNGE